MWSTSAASDLIDGVMSEECHGKPINKGTIGTASYVWSLYQLGKAARTATPKLLQEMLSKDG
jgi:hypothetical protein